MGIILAGPRPAAAVPFGALLLVPLVAGAALLRARVAAFDPGMDVLH